MASKFDQRLLMISCYTRCPYRVSLITGIIVTLTTSAVCLHTYCTRDVSCRSNDRSHSCIFLHSFLIFFGRDTVRCKLQCIQCRLENIRSERRIQEIMQQPSAGLATTEPTATVGDVGPSESDGDEISTFTRFAFHL